MAIPNTKGTTLRALTPPPIPSGTIPGRNGRTLLAAATAVSDSAWLLTGNSGTVDGVNFIGTLDNVPLNIRVNNQPSGRIDQVNGNTFWGYSAGLANTTGNKQQHCSWVPLIA